MPVIWVGRDEVGLVCGIVAVPWGLLALFDLILLGGHEAGVTIDAIILGVSITVAYFGFRDWAIRTYRVRRPLPKQYRTRLLSPPASWIEAWVEDELVERHMSHPPERVRSIAASLQQSPAATVSEWRRRVASAVDSAGEALAEPRTPPSKTA